MNEFYYLNSTGQKIGPLPLSDASVHRIGPNTMVWMSGMTAWQRAAEVPEVMAYVRTVTPPPAYGGGAASNGYQGKPKSYLWLGILTTLLCCLPAGVVSIVYAAQVDSLLAQGKYDESWKASKKAKTWGLVSAVVGFVVWVLYSIYAVFVLSEVYNLM